MNWKTLGQKLLSIQHKDYIETIHLRIQISQRGIRRVQRSSHCLFGLIPVWCTINDEDAFCETLMFNCPTRLVWCPQEIHGQSADNRVIEWATNNVLPLGHKYIPWSHSQMKRYVVGLFHAVDRNNTYVGSDHKVHHINEFFRLS